MGSIFQKEDKPIPMAFKVRGGPEIAQIQSLADTGSQIDVIPEEIYMILFGNVQLRPSSVAQTATGEAPFKQPSTGPKTLTHPAQRLLQFTC